MAQALLPTLRVSIFVSFLNAAHWACWKGKFMLSLSHHSIARHVFTAALVIGASASIGVVAWAMRVSPMVSELTTSGAGSTARIEVGNIGNAPLPFETLMTRMDLDHSGNVIEMPADDNFLVFPPQGIVPVGGRQVVRVQWIGRPNIPASEAYYLWVKQLPVSTSSEPSETGGSASFQVLYTMKALIVVAPNGAEPDVSVVSSRVVPLSGRLLEDENNKDEELGPARTHGVEVNVINNGRRYALMSGATWTVEGLDKSGQPYHKQFNSDAVSATIGIGYLPPLGGRRSFTLPTDVELDDSKPLKISFSS